MYNNLRLDIINIDSNKLAEHFDSTLTSLENAVSSENVRMAYYYGGQLKMMATINNEFYYNERFKEVRRKAAKAGYSLLG